MTGRRLAISVILAAAIAHAEEPSGLFGNLSLTSTKDPIEIRSDRLEFDSKTRQAIFRGDVEVLQGEIQLDSDTLTVSYAEVGENQEIREVVADGNVRIEQGARRARGKRAVFDQEKRVLVLTGDAVLEEGANQITGDTIEVYPDESRMEVKGQNRRVKVILFPDQAPTASDDERGDGEG